jgi:colanic acid biosynthesis glycosyl transferase WcaI
MVKTLRPLKIVIVSQYYKPEGAVIPGDLAQGLSERGHHVRVLTGYPNYPEGRLYSGYRQKLVHHEKDGDVGVRRVPIVISHSQNAITRFASYASFALSSLAAGRFVREADVIYVYATQMTAAFAPSVWRKTWGIPFVLHIQDLWPESVTGSSMVRGGLTKRALNGILNAWLSVVYRQSAAIIAIAPTMKKMLIDRGIAAEHVVTSLNWADESAVSEASRPEEAGSGKLSVVYAGNLGEFQGLESVIRAAALVTDLDGFTLTLVGAGVLGEKLRQLAHDLAATNVVFQGRVPRTAMTDIYASSDFQLVPLADLAIFRGTIPSKLQGSLLNGIPVITTVAGDVSEIVRMHNLGLASPPGDVAALARTFRDASALTASERRVMGENARTYYLEEMSMRSGIERIEGVLARVAKPSEEEE